MLKNNLLFLLLISCILSQEIPNQFYEHKIKELNLGLRNNWEENTNFGPIRYSKLSTNDSLIIDSRFGYTRDSNRRILYGYGHFTYNRYFHAYLYPRIVNEPFLINGYSGIQMDISRGGFTSGETDMSGICFENDWMIIQLGRGRQSWGAGNDIQLALSKESNSYDYAMLGLDFGKLNVRYFHGFLEADSMRNNRYITGRGIEWNNGKSFLIGISEIIIYSGQNRSIDFSYFNPISTHLEIELNERQNNIGTASGNGVWQISFDYLFMQKFRLSGNYLFDEFTLDKEQLNAGKGPGRAHSFKVLYTMFHKNKTIASLYLSNISVGTNTFKHQIGNNNFVQRGKPLGWQIGSDSEELKIGLNIGYNNIIASIELGLRNIGEKNIYNEPYHGYTDYLDIPFPSGNVETINFGISRVQWWWKQNLSIFSEFHYHHSNFSKKSLDFNLGIDIFFSLKTKL